MKYITKAWVARDKDGSVFMYKNRPNKEADLGRWVSEDMQYQNITWWKDEFGDLSWAEDAPREIEVSMRLINAGLVMKVEVGKHIQDIFPLECVSSIDKSADGKVRVMVREYNGMYSWAYEGDFICQREDGLWMVVKKGGME